MNTKTPEDESHSTSPKTDDLRVHRVAFVHFEGMMCSTATLPRGD